MQPTVFVHGVPCLIQAIPLEAHAPRYYLRLQPEAVVSLPFPIWSLDLVLDLTAVNQLYETGDLMTALRCYRHFWRLLTIYGHIAHRTGAQSGILQRRLAVMDALLDADGIIQADTIFVQTAQTMGVSLETLWGQQPARRRRNLQIDVKSLREICQPAQTEIGYTRAAGGGYFLAPQLRIIF